MLLHLLMNTECIQNELLYLWKKICLFEYKTSCMNDLNDDFMFILAKLKNHKEENYIELYTHIFCFLAHIRDIHLGMGLRTLYYSFVHIVYEFFPILTCGFLKTMMYKHDFQTLGSWRDAPNICLFLKKESKQGEQHPLIDHIIELMNSVLYDETVYFEKTKTCITNIAKWIPRETSKNKWLFEKLAVHWSKTHTYLLNNDFSKKKSSYDSALRKCYMNYRKIVSKLSKSLPIIEQHMCKNEFKNIKLENISQKALVKYWDTLFHQTSSLNHKNCLYEERVLCAATLNSEVQTYEKPFKICNYKVGFIHFPDCIQNYVSYALRCASIIESFANSTPNCEKLGNEMMKLDKIWEYVYNKWSCYVQIDKNTIPVIHINVHCLTDPILHRAIAHACFILQSSDVKRIVFCSINPIWINLENDHTFISKIRTIYKALHNEVLINSDVHENIRSLKHMQHFNIMVIIQNGFCFPYGEKYSYNDLLSILTNERYKDISQSLQSFF